MDLGEKTFIVALFEEFPSPWHGLFPRGTSFFGPGPFSPAFRIFPEWSGPINCGANAQIFRRFASKTPLWPSQPSSRSLLMFGDFLLKWSGQCKHKSAQADKVKKRAADIENWQTGIPEVIKCISLLK